VRALFVGLYGEQIKDKRSTVINCDKFAPYFERQMQDLEGQSDATSSTPNAKLTPPSSTDNESADEDAPKPAALPKAQRPLYDTSVDSTPVPTPDASRPTTPAQTHLMTGKSRPGLGTKLSRRDRKKAAVGNSAPASSGDEASVKRKGKSATKKNRVWGEFGAEEEDPSMVLDYSQSDLRDETSEVEALEEIKQETWGRKTGKGQFVLKDLDMEMDAIISKQNAKKESSTEAPTGLVGSSLGAIGGLFKNFVGGKTLTKEELAKPLKGMQDHLLKKNVAQEAAIRLCESVERDLVGLKTSSFTSEYSFCSMLFQTDKISDRDDNPHLHGKSPHQDTHTHLIP